MLVVVVVVAAAVVVVTRDGLLASGDDGVGVETAGGSRVPVGGVPSAGAGVCGGGGGEPVVVLRSPMVDSIALGKLHPQEVGGIPLREQQRRGGGGGVDAGLLAVRVVRGVAGVRVAVAALGPPPPPRGQQGDISDGCLVPILGSSQGSAAVTAAAALVV